MPRWSSLHSSDPVALPHTAFFVSRLSRKSGNPEKSPKIGFPLRVINVTNVPAYRGISMGIWWNFMICRPKNLKNNKVIKKSNSYIFLGSPRRVRNAGAPLRATPANTINKDFVQDRFSVLLFWNFRNFGNSKSWISRFWNLWQTTAVWCCVHRSELFEA